MTRTHIPLNEPKLILKFPEDRVFNSTKFIGAQYCIIEPVWYYNKLESGIITDDKTELEELVRICQIKSKIPRGYWTYVIESQICDFTHKETNCH
jgi:hypothetical protein